MLEGPLKAGPWATCLEGEMWSVGDSGAHKARGTLTSLDFSCIVHVSDLTMNNDKTRDLSNET